jgi:hypothetical protein
MRVVTKTAKLATHVIPEEGKLLTEPVTPSLMPNCAKQKLTDHANQQNKCMINKCTMPRIPRRLLKNPICNDREA